MGALWARCLRYTGIFTAGMVICVLSCCSDDTDFSRKLGVEVSKGPGTTIRFADLTAFDWERVCIYGSYHPLEEINEKHKTSLKGRYGVNHVSEGDCLYVFEGDRKTIAATYHRRYQGSCVTMEKMYDRANAVFTVHIERPGSHPILKRKASGPAHPVGRRAR